MFREMRRKNQALTREECAALLQTERRGALAVIGDEGYPYAVPINFYYDEEDGRIYLHCAREGHKLDAVCRCDKVCFTVWERGEQREDWSYHVRSVVAMGRAELVTDEALARRQLDRLARKYYPPEDDFSEDMRKNFPRVQMLAINIEHLSGKLVHEK